MANRIRPIAEKVQPVQMAFGQINVEAAARQAGVPASTLRYDLNKVKQALPEILVNQKPGPTAQARRSEPGEEAPSSTPILAAGCPKCDGKVTKNGTYLVLNWLLMLTVGWLGKQWIGIQRHRCRECGHEVITPERERQIEGRRAWWRQVNRLIGLSRFKLGLSVRKTELLVKFVYGRSVSIGHIHRLTQGIGVRAEAALACFGYLPY